MRNFLLLLILLVIGFTTHLDAQPLHVTLQNATSVNCNEELRLDVRVQDFNNLFSAQFSINWDSTVLVFDRIENVHQNFTGNNAPGFGEPGSSMNTAAQLSFAWFDASISGGLSIADNDILFSVFYNSTTNVGTPSPIEVTDNPTIKEANNSSFMNVGVTEDNSSINIVDAISPTVICPNNQSIVLVGNENMAVVDNIGPISDDNCGIDDVTYTLSGVTIGSGNFTASGQTFNEGTTTVTYTVTDFSNNPNTCSFEVILAEESISTEPLDLVVNTESVNCGGQIFDVSIDVRDFVELIGVQFSIHWDPTGLDYQDVVSTGALTGFLNFDESQVNAGILTLSWFDASNSNGLTLADNTTIFDIEFESIGGSGMTSIEITGNPLDIEVIDKDNNVTTEVDIENGEVFLSDDLNPELTCPGNRTITVADGQITIVVNDIDPIASDNCGIGSLTYQLTGTTTGSGDNFASGNTFNLGTTTVQYTATDNSGNSTTCQFNVFVGDDSPLHLSVVAENADCDAENYTIDIDVANFTNISGLQFSINWDETIFDFEGTSDLLLQPNGNFTMDTDLLDNGILTFSWFDNMNPNGVNLLDGTTIFSANFALIGSTGNTALIGITDNTLEIEATAVVNNNTQVVPVTVSNANVMVSDNEAPQVTCRNITRNLGTDGTVSISPLAVELNSSDNCSEILARSLSQSFFACNSLGTNTVTLTIEDSSGNENFCTASVTITDNNSVCLGMFNPIIGDLNLLIEVFGDDTDFPADISDPCVCRNNAPPIENGETSDAGLFSDEILIITQTQNDQWQVVGTSNNQPLPFRFDADLSLQAADLTRVMSGDVFTFVSSFMENGETYYIYSLEIIHGDNEGYSIEVRDVSGNYFITEQTSNICYYPDPFIANIGGAYSTQCDEEVTITGTELNGVSPDNYTLRIDGPNTFVPLIVTGNDCQAPLSNCSSPTLSFIPSTLNVGIYTATFIFDAGIAGMEDTDLIGCEETVVATFEIVNPPINLVCNNNIQVSLNELCSSRLTPDAILEGDQDSYDLFVVEIMNQFGQNIGDTVNIEHIGQTLMVSVRDMCSGNSCMGSILVQDKLPPRFDCDAPLMVACTADLDAIAPPIVIDNCDVSITPILIDETYENLDCENGLVARLIRTWRATDDYGNISENCHQVINVQKFTLDDVVFPPQYDNNEEDALTCNNANTDPSNTGFPTIDGGPIDGGDVCRMVASSDDQIVETCGNSFKILRTWTVYDWCEPLENGVNPREYLQIIKVEDSSDPVITCPAALTVGASNNDCSADVLLSEAVVFDLCSNFSVRTVTSFELLESNGGVTNLPFGTHTVTYTATDDCNNSVSCNTIVQVIDNIEPIAVCDQFTVVTLNAGGLVLANASSFDDGSYDNCTAVTFSARRMDGNGVFGPTVAFDCADVANNPIRVVFRVTDANGNENFCMVQVEVQDKTDPIITCPADITIDCTQDPFDMNLTGNATVVDACPITLFDHLDVANDINDCGEGTITRVFRAMDANNNESNCIQFITVSNSNDPFDEDDISFPQDINFINQCGIMVQPDDLLSAPTNYSRPIVNETACSMVAVSHEDELLSLSAPGDTACYKILRTWKVIDWCQYDPNAVNPIGRFEHVQTIKVLDEQAPVVDFPSGFTIDITSATDCFSGSFSLPLPTFTDCSSEVDIMISGDLGTSTSVSNIPPGEYEVTYTVSDGCGNAISESITVRVEDTVGPAGLCDNVATIPMNPSGMIDVSASIFVLESSLQDNCTDSEDIMIAYSTNASDSIMTFTCSELGVHEVDIWAVDEDGNWKQLCSTTIEIQDNGNCMGGLLASISGFIQTEGGLEVQEVEVGISGNFNNFETTGPDGTFSFDVPVGGDYTVDPDKDIYAINGVSTFDLVLMSKHILDINQLDSPYKLIAADVNRSGEITTLDMIQVRKLILNITDEFEDNTSWRFVRADYVFENPDAALAENFPEIYNVNDLSEDVTDADFIAVKIGDVNNSAIPSLFTTIDDRNNLENLQLEIENQHFQYQEELSIPITSSNFQDIIGFQGGLTFNTNKLAFVDIESGLLNVNEHFGLKQVEAGNLTFSWNESQSLNLSNNDVLFYLKLMTIGEGTLANNLEISNSFTQPEAYRTKASSLELMNVQLAYTKPEMAVEDELILYQNEPNPFKESTLISFYLPTASDINLSIFDLSGQNVFQKTATLEAGFHEIEVDGLHKKGIFYYKLDNSSATITRKMIKIH